MALYDPEMVGQRVGLASGILDACKRAGFSLDPEVEGQEMVFRRTHHVRGDLDVVIYTGVIRDGAGYICRASGEDAARAALVYTRADGSKIGVKKAKTVHRRGHFAAIPDRLIGRARDMYAEANEIAKRAEGKCCLKCGAPFAVSKAKKVYCAAVCWKVV